MDVRERKQLYDIYQVGEKPVKCGMQLIVAL